MANILNLDVCKFTAASAGTGSFVVSSPVTGYQAPVTAGAASSNSYRYRAESGDLTQWEVGTGVYTSSNVTLTRTPIINSAGGSSAINFSAAPQVGIGMILKEDFNGTGQIPGTQTNDSASAGNIGELITSEVTFASRFAITSNTMTTITTVFLSAGDWDANAVVGFETTGGSVATEYHIEISSAPPPTVISAPNQAGTVGTHLTYAANQGQAFPVGPRQFSLTAGTTVYFKTLSTYTNSSIGGSQTVYGFLRARRVR